MQIIAGSTDQSISIYCRALTGAALTGKAAADFTLTYRRDGANVPIVLSDLAELTTAHTDGGVKEVGNGEYRLDLPDAAVAAGADQVSVQGTVAGGVVLGYPIPLTTNSGTGVYACTWTVNDGSTALEGATVSFWLAGVLRGTGTTNASGQVSMSLDAGTYTVAISLSGYTFANTTHAVSSTASTWTKTFSMTAVSSTPSTEPDTVTVRWKVKKTDRTTCGAGDATVYLQIIEGPGTDGFIYHGDNDDFDSEVTDASGYVQFTNVPVPCKLGVKTGTSRKLKIIEIPSDATGIYDAGEIVSHDS